MSFTNDETQSEPWFGTHPHELQTHNLDFCLIMHLHIPNIGTASAHNTRFR